MPRDPRFNAPLRRPDAVTLAWIAGIALAIAAYAIGPDRFMGTVLATLREASASVDALVHHLTAATLSVVRAIAIGLYGTFVVLSLLALRRGAPAIGGLVVVSVVFLFLVWGAQGEGSFVNLRWAAALAVAALAALNATRRLSRG